MRQALSMTTGALPDTSLVKLSDPEFRENPRNVYFFGARGLDLSVSARPQLGPSSLPVSLPIGKYPAW